MDAVLVLIVGTLLLKGRCKAAALTVSVCRFPKCSPRSALPVNNV